MSGFVKLIVALVLAFGMFTVSAQAFPTSPLQDSFNRADGALTSPWVGVTQAAPGLAVRSNSTLGVSADWTDNALYKSGSPLTNSEVYATAPNTTTGVRYLYLRTTLNASFQRTGYDIDFSGGLARVWRENNNAYTQIGGSASVTLAAGDKVGADAVGSVISVYRQPVGGSWTKLLSVTDSAPVASGYIGIGQQLAAARWDDFGGGAVVAADTTPPDTTITASPSNGTSTSASFSFTSTETNSTFGCSLDGAARTSCTSPKTYSGLSVGTHTFTVAASDAAGNTDPTPASKTWTISSPPTGWAQPMDGYYNQGGAGISPMTVAANDKLVILQGPWHTSDLDAIKAANPSVKVLAYVNLTYCNNWTAPPMGSSVVSCNQAKAEGSYTGKAHSSWQWLVDVGKSGFMTDANNNANSYIWGADSKWDGVFLDDVNWHVPEGVPAGYSSQDDWKTRALDPAVQSITNNAHAHGKLVYGNFGAPGQYYPHEDTTIKIMDGYMDEFFGTWPDGSVQPISYVTNSLTDMDTAAANGKSAFVQSIMTSGSDTHRAYFGYALALIGTGNDKVYYDARNGDADYNDPLFTRAVGSPLGPRTQISSGVWRRDFTNVTVTADANSQTGTFVWK